MEPNNLEGRSRGSSFRRRALTLVGVSALTLSGVGAAVFGASQAFAAAGPAITGSITFGTSVTNVTLATNNTVEGDNPVVDTVGFVATGGISSTGTITIATSTDATIGANNSTAVVTDTTAGKVQSATLTNAGSGTSATVQLTAAIPAGDSVTVVITGGTNSSSTFPNLTVSVNTSTDLNPVKSNSVALTKAVSTTNGLSSALVGGATTLTVSTTSPTTTPLNTSDYLLVSDSSTTAPSTESAVFPTTASSYTVTNLSVSPHVSAVVTGTVTAVNVPVGNGTTGSEATYAYFVSPLNIPSNDIVSVQVTGVTNDGTAQEQTLQLVVLGATAPTGIVQAGVNGGGILTPSTSSPQYVNYEGNLTAPAAPTMTVATNANTLFTATSAATGPFYYAVQAYNQFGSSIAVASVGSQAVTDTQAVTITEPGSGVPGAAWYEWYRGTSNSSMVEIGTTIASTTNTFVDLGYDTSSPSPGSLPGAAAATGGPYWSVAPTVIQATHQPGTLLLPDLAALNSYNDAGGHGSGSTPTLETAVTGFSLSLSNSVAGTSNNTDTLSFTATNAQTSEPITVTGLDLGTGPASATLLDTTTNKYVIGVTPLAGDGTGNNSLITGNVSLTKGDAYTLTLYGVQNSATAGTATVKLYTNSDLYPVPTTYVLTAAPTVGPFVSLSDVNVSVPSTWTINGFETTVAYVGGVDTIAVTSSGSFFPAAASDYTITDLTNSAGSGAVTSVSGGSTDQATIVVPNSIASGDSLQIVITNVVNSSSAGTATNGLSLTGSAVANTSGGATLKGIAAVATTTPAATPPNAAATGSNGALVNVNGTIYVYVGGIAFGIPTPAEFNTISTALGNPAVQTATSVTTSGTVASGSLIQVVGSPQINVVGSGGTYYGFSTASQFLSDGYSFANVVQVPSLGSLTVGSGTTPTAAATGSNGALVNVNGTIYVYAGGVAVGIPTPSEFSAISAALGNPTVVAASSVTTTGTMASGTLVQVFGSPMVSVVGAAGAQTGFSTEAQFYSDGYSWSNVIMIP